MRFRLFASAALSLAAVSVPATGVAQLQLGPPGATPPSAQSPQRTKPNVRQVKPQEPVAPQEPELPPEDGAPAAQPASPAQGRAKPGDIVAPGAPDETVIAPPKQKITNATAVFSGLDKITGRIITFDVAIDETVQFGALQVTPRVCYTRPPTETPQTDAFVEVNEVTLQGEVRKQFTGWMFAASPGLSGVEHPVYDVWLNDCRQGKPQPAGSPPPARPKS